LWLEGQRQEQRFAPAPFSPAALLWCRVTPVGVRLCRPSEAVLDLLPIQESEFVKEDGERVIDTRVKGAV
jgi:hypothetical protein